MNVERLKEIREDKDLTQKEVAEIIHVSQQQYNKYELGINSIPIEKLNKWVCQEKCVSCQKYSQKSNCQRTRN